MTPVQTHYERPFSTAGSLASLWFVGIARIGILLLTAAGAYRLGTYAGLGYFLTALYGFAVATSLLYLVSLRRRKTVSPALTWTQIMMDFAVVAATLSCTGGIRSFFTFLLVVVILEAGVLLGLAQGFVFATLASAFMCVQACLPQPPEPHTVEQWIELWYRFLIQTLAFYLTAFVSGYWNQRLTQMEQFQSRILDNMNSGFLIIDPKGVITVMNKVAHQILNLVPGAAIGRPVQEVLRPGPGGECPVLTALRSERDFLSYEFQAMTAPGEAKLLGLTTSHVHDGHDRLTGVIASFTDLTEMDRMRRELQSQDRLAAVGELAAGLAHEIRNPVAAIRGAVDELPVSLDKRPVAEKLAAIAVRESDHLDHIVAGFLDFARDPSIEREVFDLRELVSEVEGLLRRDNADAEGLTIATVLPEHPCDVSGDRPKIKQVFVNLGKNAIEAMQGRGTLTVALTRTNGSFEVRFDDEGPGIDPDKVTKIFEPFYTDKERGVGMGLAVCLRIITAHDGTIRAASRVGGGAAMRVRLPAARGKE